MSPLVVPQQQADDLTGTGERRPFDPKNPAHLARKHKCFVDDDGQSNVLSIPDEKSLTFKLSGVTKINGFFETWVKKGSVIGEDLSKTFKYYRTAVNNLDEDLAIFILEIYAYDGEGDTDWAWDESDYLLPNFRLVCTLKADLSGLQKYLKAQKTSEGRDFWTVDYKVKVLLGGTALKARISWKEGVSISRLYPHVTDIWLYLSENRPRRSHQRYSELSLLGHVCFPS